MDEENGLETQDTLIPENEESDSQDTPVESETTDKDKIIADLREQNKQLFARTKKAEGKGHNIENTEAKPPVVPAQDVKSIVAAELEERDLDSLEVSDNVKSEIRAIAKAKGISIRAAAKSDYIGFIQEKEVAKAREEEASASTKGTGKSAKRDFSSLSEDDVRKLDSEEFTQYKGWLKSQE